MFSRSKSSKLAYILCTSMLMVVCSGCGTKQHDTSSIVSLDAITYPIDAVIVDIPEEEVPVVDTVKASQDNSEQDTLSDNSGTADSPDLASPIVEEDSHDRYYQFTSTYTDLYIEEFALQIKTDILTGNWEDLSGLISYPITIMGTEYKSSSEFLAGDWDNAFNSEWLGELMEEDCSKMGQNGEGFMMANGEIWVFCLPSGASSQLKIVAING